MVAFLMATTAEPRASDGEKLPESSGGSVWRSNSVMSRVRCTLKVARKGSRSSNSTLDILSGSMGRSFITPNYTSVVYLRGRDAAGAKEAEVNDGTGKLSPSELRRNMKRLVFGIAVASTILTAPLAPPPPTRLCVVLWGVPGRGSRHQ